MLGAAQLLLGLCGVGLLVYYPTVQPCNNFMAAVMVSVRVRKELRRGVIV